MNIDPLHQFMISKIIPIHFHHYDISLTNCGAFMIVSALLVVTFFAIALRGERVVPNSLQSMAEMPIYMVQSLIKENNGPKGEKFLPFIGAIFLFLFMGNMLGMCPFSFTFTSQIIINLLLSCLVIVVVSVVGIFTLKSSFFRVFCAKGIPWWVSPILVPVEIISYFSRPISLAVRLFANMVAGHSMLKIFAYFTSEMGILGVMPLMVNVGLIGFEILVAFLQAYVFTMLSCIYFNDAIHIHD